MKRRKGKRVKRDYKDYKEYEKFWESGRHLPEEILRGMHPHMF